jgi:peptide chain release factor 2
MQKLSRLQETVKQWTSIEQRSQDLLGLVELAIPEADSSLEETLTEEVRALSAELEKEELELMFSEQYDTRNALITIHAGAGGVDSQDWAQILLRMYLRWAEQNSRKASILDMSQGEEAGIKSATIEIQGHLSYGYLRGEKGVHRLVRLSPYDAAHLRHTSFALVEIMPEAETRAEVNIRTEDLRIDTFKASGAGGQHVQKNSTAIRITHLPSRIVVSCQNERSQFQNKETALKILEARLMQRQLEAHLKKQAEIKGDHIAPEWGNQIRNYILHPYKLVKDNRSNYETSNVESILDGNLNELLEAFLRTTIRSDN